MSYYIDRREQRKAIFKPYNRNAVKRDLRDALRVSTKLSRANRRYRRTSGMKLRPSGDLRPVDREQPCSRTSGSPGQSTGVRIG